MMPINTKNDLYSLPRTSSTRYIVHEPGIFHINANNCYCSRGHKYWEPSVLGFHRSSLSWKESTNTSSSSQRNSMATSRWCCSIQWYFQSAKEILILFSVSSR